MEFHEKLQSLRREKGLTQEELAQALYVSRAAVSKWESGRGYPNIDSLKDLSRFFGVTIDEMLTGEEALQAAQEDHTQQTKRTREMILGLLDLSAALLFFLPLFGQKAGGAVESVLLLRLTGVQPWLKAAYFAWTGGMTLCGILLLALRSRRPVWWERSGEKLSFLLHTVTALLFILSRQPYAAALLFIFLIIKVLLLIRRP